MARTALIAMTLACMALMAAADWQQRYEGGWQPDGRRDHNYQWQQQQQYQQQWQQPQQYQQQWQQPQQYQQQQYNQYQGGSNGKWSFETSMDGYQNGVNTYASGSCSGTVDEYAQTLTGSVTVRNIKQVTGIHFHLGPRGQTGDKVAWLWPSDTKAFTPQPFDTDSWTVSFTIKATDIIPAAKPFAVNNFGDFVRALKEGNIYVNVHTKQTKDGEIRGQISTSS